MENLKRKAIKISIFIGLLLITGLLLEVFGNYIPNFRVSRSVEKVVGAVYLTSIYIATQYIYIFFDARNTLIEMGTPDAEIEAIREEQRAKKEAQRNNKQHIIRYLPILYCVLVLASVVIVPYKSYYGVKFGLVSLDRARYIDFSALVLELLFISILTGLFYIFLRTQLKKED